MEGEPVSRSVGEELQEVRGVVGHWLRIVVEDLVEPHEILGPDESRARRVADDRVDLAEAVMHGVERAERVGKPPAQISLHLRPVRISQWRTSYEQAKVRASVVQRERHDVEKEPLR